MARHLLQGFIKANNTLGVMTGRNTNCIPQQTPLPNINGFRFK
jgi:DNA-binding transcriptional regulator LsrR (DeoR family)